MEALPRARIERLPAFPCVMHEPVARAVDGVKSVKNDMHLKCAGAQAADTTCANERKSEGNDMSKLMIALFVSAGLGLAGCAAQRDAPVTATKPMAPVVPITKDAYDAAVKNAETQFRIDKDACSSRSGNAKDICLAEATGREKVAKADAGAAYTNTPKAREESRVARAEGNYGVAKEKCDDLAGNPRDVCVKEADAALVKAKADAHVDRVAADTRQEAATKQAEARRDATADKREADYQVAIEKCDALAGAAKDACVSNAKVQYGKR